MLSENVFVPLLRPVAKDVTSSFFRGINAMIFMPELFDDMAKDNARYKRKKSESDIPSPTSIYFTTCLILIMTLER